MTAPELLPLGKALGTEVLGVVTHGVPNGW